MAERRPAEINFSDFKDCIDFYYHHRKTEYVMTNGASPHQNFFLEQGLAMVNHKYTEDQVRVVVSDEAIERFHPNKIDNKEFWTYAKTKFPKFSVCGAPTRTINDCNHTTLNIPKSLGILDFIDKMISVTGKDKLDFFEIGYGHGNIFYQYNEKVNYLGIDFHKLKKLNKHKNLMIIEKSGIPDTVKPYSQDIVYSVNVLQHCSQKDRFSYFVEIAEKLKYGGFFIGHCFLLTAQNKDEAIWGVEDRFGRRYCNFFNQLTEVDTELEFFSIMKVLGFRFEAVGINGNNFTFILQKT